MSGAGQLVAARRPVLETGALRAAVLDLRGLSRGVTYDSYTPDLQVVIPLRGAHYLSAGKVEQLVDLNQIGLIPADVVTRDRHPDQGDASCLVITPCPATLDEIWHGTGTNRDSVNAAGFTTRTSSPAAQLAAFLACHPRGPAAAGLREAREEILLGIVRGAACAPAARPIQLASRSRKLVAAVKELLIAAASPLSLTQIARQVGASPAYLTDLFRRSEGMPIYRYQLRLRLALALARLPQAEDITGLALDLGFSSHSHFTAVFRSTFGLAPSRYREATRPVPRATSPKAPSRNYRAAALAEQTSENCQVLALGACTIRM